MAGLPLGKELFGEPAKQKQITYIFHFNRLLLLRSVKIFAQQ